jgi:hypothetical protein
MSATSGEIKPPIDWAFYQDLCIRNIDWIQLAELALNGKPPYSGFGRTLQHLLISENLLMIACLLAPNELIASKALQLLKKHIYTIERYSSLLQSSKVLTPDEHPVIDGYTAEQLRRGLENIDEVPIAKNLLTIIAIRIEALKTIIKQDTKHPFYKILEEQQQRAHQLGNLIEGIILAPSSPSSSTSHIPCPPTLSKNTFFAAFFDRDDTIFDKTQLINPEALLPFLIHLGQNPKNIWGITSSGAIALERDPAYVALRRLGYQGPPPLYAQVSGRSTGLINRVCHVDILSTNKPTAPLEEYNLFSLSELLSLPQQGIYVDKRGSILICTLINSQLIREDYVLSLASASDLSHCSLTAVENLVDLCRSIPPEKLTLDILSALKKPITTELTKAMQAQIQRVALDALVNKGVTIDEKKRQIKATIGPLSFTYPSSGIATFKFGQTLISLSLRSLSTPELLQSFDLGDYKLFLIFELLDQANVTLDLNHCPALLKLGITQIVAPAHYSVVSQQNIIFLDDKRGCTDLIASSGFHAIHADTEAAWHEAEEVRKKINDPTLSQPKPLTPIFNTYIAFLYDAYFKVTGTRIPLVRYFIRNLKDFIHVQIPQQKFPLTGNTLYRFRNSTGEVCEIEIPVKLKMLLDHIYEIDRCHNGEKIHLLISTMEKILTNAFSKKTTNLFLNNKAFYKTLIDRLAPYRETLTLIATPSTPSLLPVSSSSTVLLDRPPGL